MTKIFDSIIIGAGPCGISAAINLKKMGYEIILFEKSIPGGKVNIAPQVDNYPHHPSTPGPDLAIEFYNRLVDNKIEIVAEEVISINKNENIFEIKTNLDTYFSYTVVISTGTKERKLGFPNEDRLLGHGISYCALCDGHFFKDKDVIVIGGGNSALKEAIYLQKIVKNLTVIHRRNEFRGNEKLVNELRSFDNVKILTPYIPLEILEENRKVVGLLIQNREDESKLTLKADGIFPLIGQIPNTEFMKNLPIFDEYNNCVVDKNMMTAVSGLFAGGDVTSRPIRQIYLAEFDGTRIAKSIDSYLKENK